MHTPGTVELAPHPVPEECRYLEQRDLVDGLLDALRWNEDDDEDARLLAALADTATDLARLSPRVHHPLRDGALITEDRDDARFAQLLAEVAAARAQRRPRNPGQVPELENHPYTRAVLAQMAGQAEQPGWVLAHRINSLIDHALDAGLHTRLPQRLAYAVSCRPDGENAAEHENADQTAHDTGTSAAA